MSGESPSEKSPKHPQLPITEKDKHLWVLSSFLMRWVFMHIALKGYRPPHTNEPVQFWIGFGLVLIGGSGLNPFGLLTPHWIIQLVIDRNAIENL